MTENEDSVVTSLNELRKLKHERITRQTQSRAVVGSGRAAALAEDPYADQPTPMPIDGLALVRGQRAPSSMSGLSVARQDGFARPSPGYDPMPVQAPPVIQTKPSYAAAVVVGVLLIGAGGAGYVKLQNDTQAILLAKDASIKQAEEARMRALDSAAKSDQQFRTNLRQCEDKLKATAAVAPVSAPMSSPIAPAVDAKAGKPAAVAKAASHPARGRVSARPVRHAAQAEAAAPKSTEGPLIAKKKKLQDDPLAGLGKP